jgi:Ion channel
VNLRPIRRLEASHSYGLLLGVILVSLIFQASASDTRASRVVVVALQACILLLALWTSRTPERDFRWGIVAVVVALVATMLLALSNDPKAHDGGLLIVGALVVLVVPAVIAHGVFHGIRERGVTLQTAYGVLCVYLLIGMLFAFAFGAVAVLQSGPLFTNGTEGDLQAHLYFSFTTITTVGYGDLAPAGDLARAFSILEALIGQLYLVTVVAVIVGNLGRPRTR